MMELLQELLLTMIVSVLIALLLGKILSIGDDDRHRRASAEKAVAAVADSGLHHARAAAATGGAVLVTQGSGGVEVVGEIRRESGEDGRGTVEAARGCDRLEMDVGRREGEIAYPEEEESTVVKGGVERSEEARACELDLEKAMEGQKKSDVDEDGLEENWVDEVPEKVQTETIELSLAGEEEGSTKDGVDEDSIRGSLDEEEDVLGNLETREIGIELVKEGKRSAGVGADKVKDVPVLDDEMMKRVELDSEIGGVERGGKDEKAGSSYNEDDDWEGIERSELEKLFGAAAGFVSSVHGGESGHALSKLSSDLQLQLYGLQKIATEGPCYESQPMALKVAARTKWHAWQRLGSMNPEVAMEQYIALLSDNIPDWMKGKLTNDRKQEEGGDSMDAGIPESGAPNLPQQEQQIQENPREPGSHSSTGGGNKTGLPKYCE